MNNVIFISYSHNDKNYRDELVPVLETVGSIRDRLWVDQKKLDIGDQFHPAIQQALAGTRVALLLVSNAFLTSKYITQHELPYLLDQAERDALKLGILYIRVCLHKRIKTLTRIFKSVSTSTNYDNF